MQPCFRCLRTLLLYLHATRLAVQGISSFLERTAPTSVATCHSPTQRDRPQALSTYKPTGLVADGLRPVLHGNCKRWTDLNLGIDGGRPGISNLLANRKPRFLHTHKDVAS